MTTARNMIDITNRLGQRGFTVFHVEVHTPDQRTWAIEHQSGGGFRLFELDADHGTEPTEHDSANGNGWTASDLIDYLAAVGG